MGMLYAASSCFVFLFTAVACSGDMDEIRQFERQTPPDQEIKNAHIRRSERGQRQMELDAPLIRKYSQPSERTVYPRGVDIRFFSEGRRLKTSIHAGQAVSFDDRNIMKASDSVVVIDYGTGDTIYLEDIIWRSDEDLIYSNNPVRSVNGNRVTYGDGFVSDEKMANMRITRQRGVIEFQE